MTFDELSTKLDEQLKLMNLKFFYYDDEDKKEQKTSYYFLDDETSWYGSKNFYSSWRHDGDVKDIHYQIISKDKYTEDEFEDVD